MAKGAHDMFRIMRALLFAAILSGFLGPSSLAAQYVPLECPRQYSDGSYIDGYSRTLTGSLVFHDDLRQWLSLKLDAPVCGLQELELVHTDEMHPLKLEVFRGCHVAVTGILGLPATGYYSAELYQDVDRIEPAAGCVRKARFPDYSKLKPAPAIRSYRVAMWFNYGSDGPLHATVTTGGRSLGPWQVYTSYFLTGEFAFYGYCADGFLMEHLAGTPAAKPWMVDNYFAMDPESAAEKNVHEIKVGFTCTRSR